MGAALRRCWRQRRRSVAGYTLTIFIQILPQSSFNLMGIWIFHRCNSKRGSFFLYLNESSALCDGKVYALMYIYHARKKIPYSIFPACFSSRAARACICSAPAANRGYIFLLQFTKWKRAEYTQATSQSANQPTSQAHSPNVRWKFQQPSTYIYFCALYCICMCAAICMWAHRSQQCSQPCHCCWC